MKLPAWIDPRARLSGAWWRDPSPAPAIAQSAALSSPPTSGLVIIAASYSSAACYHQLHILFCVSSADIRYSHTHICCDERHLMNISTQNLILN